MKGFGLILPLLHEREQEVKKGRKDQGSGITVVSDRGPSEHFTYCTVCPGSSDPFYIACLLYTMGHYFMDILYVY